MTEQSGRHSISTSAERYIAHVVTLAATTNATKRKLSIFSHDAGRLSAPRLVKLQIVETNQFRHIESNT
jgi:hypothetical protein